MRNSILSSPTGITVSLIVLVSLAVPMIGHAQGRRGGGRGGPPASAEAGAPIDLTGYWESVVTFDWEIRMVTPRPGDYAGVPLKPAGVEVMDAWDPAKDTAAGLECKSYGAPNIMRVPGHLHITWQDDQTLKMETDAGQQTRLFRFVKSDAAAAGPRTWQGYSAAEWNLQRVGAGGQPGTDIFRPGRVAWGSLQVTTTDLKAGYLRKNGVPYSDDATLLEYYDLVDEGNGRSLMVVTSVVKDPTYLFIPYITTSQYLKQANDAGWEPSACSATW
jgi:hypothetical protein